MPWVLPSWGQLLLDPSLPLPVRVVVCLVIAQLRYLYPASSPSWWLPVTLATTSLGQLLLGVPDHTGHPRKRSVPRVSRSVLWVVSGGVGSHLCPTRADHQRCLDRIAGAGKDL